MPISAAPGYARRMSSPRLVLAVAVLGTFMAFVDATIVNIAVPNIALHFSDSPLSSISWVLNAYNIVFAAFLVGSLLDNLPLEPMSSSGEGPVLTLDVKGGEERPRAAAPAPAPGVVGPAVGAPAGATAAGDPPEHPDSARVTQRRRLPSLPETMGRIALLSSANTDESARRHADLTILVRVSGVGLVEFHQIDQAREAGRRIARAALEQHPPGLAHRHGGRRRRRVRPPHRAAGLSGPPRPVARVRADSEAGVRVL